MKLPGHSHRCQLFGGLLLTLALAPGCTCWVEVLYAELELSSDEALEVGDLMEDSAEPGQDLTVTVTSEWGTDESTECSLSLVTGDGYFLDEECLLGFVVPEEAWKDEGEDARLEVFTVLFEVGDADSSGVPDPVAVPGGHEQAELWNGWPLSMEWELSPWFSCPR